MTDSLSLGQKVVIGQLAGAGWFFLGVFFHRLSAFGFLSRLHDEVFYRLRLSALACTVGWIGDLRLAARRRQACPGGGHGRRRRISSGHRLRHFSIAVRFCRTMGDRFRRAADELVQSISQVRGNDSGTTVRAERLFGKHFTRWLGLPFQQRRDIRRDVHRNHWRCQNQALGLGGGDGSGP